MSESADAALRLTPYWWEGLEPLPDEGRPLPERAEVVVVGAGYTGLNAALQIARGERQVLVIDAEAPGWGCSSRNGGQVSSGLKPDLASLTQRYGPERAAAIIELGRESLAWTGRFIAEEEIDCAYRVCGKFHGAHSPAAFRRLLRRYGEGPELERGDIRIVPREQQREEIGTDAYHGGLVFTRHASLDPARYLRGLLVRAQEAGASVVAPCRLLELQREAGGWRLQTSAGSLQAEEVVMATNGYSGPAQPWLRRRVIPIGSYIIATEPLAPAVMQRLMPRQRTVTDSRKVVYYYRSSPDGRRILFGGRVSHGETHAHTSGRRLHQSMTALFPELRETRITHSWSGFVAYSFDELPHIGRHEGLHYAMGYCGSGVGLSGYLGMKLGRQVLGAGDGATALDGLDFPTRPLYHGRPWFLPVAVWYHRTRDSLGF
ncbi:NAD(P)/FAD-dependent oxidoreductase [Aquibaculum sediminis]|uniref:NAD(P)/FAD-dependent oxidoreductase n=1 Tax=Aquibaculum sediminis TaxID=3231907 RepID=UPI003453EDFA